MRGSITLGHVRGIPIRAHFTLLFILPYLAFLMAARFGAVAREAGVAGETMLLPPIVWGLLLAVALFVCVLLHELGHSLLALHFGGQVSSITLMLLGGVSELKGIPRTPRKEGLIAAAGPAVSVVLGGAALLLHHFVGGPPDVRFGLFYLGQINLALAIFNLLPAFPMDGGRVLRAILATRWSRPQATRIAAATGTFFAALFVIGGLFSGNIMLMLIGLFVWSGAREEAEMTDREELVRGLRVKDVMTPTHHTVQSTDPVARAAEEMAAEHVSALPVTEGNELLGVVTAHHLETLRPEERARTSVAAVTERNVPWLDSEDPLSQALARMAEARAEEAPVLHGGLLVGILDVADLGRTTRLRRFAEPQLQRPPLLTTEDQPPASPIEATALQRVRV
jgi:Zn-dependent protease/predicted transcriptional regulator